MFDEQTLLVRETGKLPRDSFEPRKDIPYFLFENGMLQTGINFDRGAETPAVQIFNRILRS